MMVLMFSNVCFGNSHESNVDKFLDDTCIKSEMDKDNKSFKGDKSYVALLTPKNPSEEIKKSISELFESVDSSNYKKLLVDNMSKVEMEQALIQSERVKHIFKKVEHKIPLGNITYDGERLSLIKKLVYHSKDVVAFDSVGFEDGLIKNLSLKYTDVSDSEIQDLIIYYSHPVIQKERQLYIHFSMRAKKLTNDLFKLFEKESKK